MWIIVLHCYNKTKYISGKKQQQKLRNAEEQNEKESSSSAKAEYNRKKHIYGSTSY